MKLKALLPAVAISLSAVALTACGGNKTEQATADQAQTSDLKIHVATESSYRPFSYLDASGEVIGYEIDLMNALCTQMKAECEITSQDWDGLIPGLQAEKFDAVIAGMSITPDRQKVVDFTDPYFSSGIILTAKADSDISIDNLEGKAVGAQRSTVSSQYLEDNQPKANINLYDTQENAYIDLTNGRLDAMLTDKVIGLDWLKQNADKGYEQKGADISTGNDDMGIAVRKDSDLLPKFNEALATLKENGTYDEITAKYFGESK